MKWFKSKGIPGIRFVLEGALPFSAAVLFGPAVLFAPNCAAAPLVTFEDVSASFLPLSTLGNNSMDASPVDLDGDGDLDLVVASEFRPNLILINDGTGLFTNESAARIAQPFHDSEDIGIGDFDQNGAPDILFVSEDDQVNELYLNDGNGFFSDASARILVTGTSNSVLVAFINGDAFPDIIIGNAGQNVVLINDGSAHFVDETSIRLPTNLLTTQDLEWGDVDGDGDNDLVEGNENGNRLLLNDGNGFFTDATAGRLPLPKQGEETREADLGDVDGDGDLDLFFANVTFGEGYPPQNRLLLNDGAGFFSDVTSTHLPISEQFTVDGDFVDLDEDGDLDLATAQAFEGTYQLLLNDGTGHFSGHTAVLFETLPTGNGIDVEAADFTGDGRLDLYLTGFQQTDYLFRGRVDPSSVPAPAEGTGLRLAPSVPNPVRDKATIGFSLDQTQRVTLRILDVNGAVVVPVSNEVRQVGYHEVSWDVRDVPTGRYFCQLRGEKGQSLSREILVLK